MIAGIEAPRNSVLNKNTEQTKKEVGYSLSEQGHIDAKTTHEWLGHYDEFVDKVVASDHMADWGFAKSVTSTFMKAPVTAAAAIVEGTGGVVDLAERGAKGIARSGSSSQHRRR